MKNHAYYGVAGKNGFGVYTDYDKVLISKPYIAGMRCKKFYTMMQAKVFAINTYRMIQESPLICTTEDIKLLNWFYHSDLIKNNHIRPIIFH